MHLIQQVFTVDDRVQAGALDKAEQVMELAIVTQAGAEDLQLIPFLYQPITLSASLAVLQHCLRFTFAYSIDIKTE